MSIRCSVTSSLVSSIIFSRSGKGPTGPAGTGPVVRVTIGLPRRLLLGFASAVFVPVVALAQSSTAASSKAASSSALVEAIRSGVTARCAEAAGTVTCSVTASNGTLIEAFALENPGRLVADFKGNVRGAFKAPNSKPQVASKPDRGVKQVRFGLNGDVLRVVFDLSGTGASDGGAAAVSISKAANSTTFSFAAPRSTETTESVSTVSAQPSEAKPLKAEAPALAATAAPSPVPANTRAVPVVSPTALASFTPATSTPATSTPATVAPTKVATKAPATPSAAPSTPVPFPSARPTEQPRGTATKSAPAPVASSSSSVAEETPKASLATTTQTDRSVGSRIEKVTFEKVADGGSSIRVVLTGKPEVKVAKLDERTYEAVITGYQLAGRYLALPYFPPEDFAGVTHVKLSQKPDTVQVIIGVNRGVRITPVAKEGELVLRVSE